MFFKYLASKNQLPGFYISGALAENGLILSPKTLIQTVSVEEKFELMLHKKYTSNTCV